MSIQNTMAFAGSAYGLAHESVSLAVVLVLSDLKALDLFNCLTRSVHAGKNCCEGGEIFDF